MSAISEQELRWKSRRGMLELDLLLRNFIDNCYQSLDEEQLNHLVVLLDYPDQVLQDLLVNGSASRDQNLTQIISLIRRSQLKTLTSV